MVTEFQAVLWLSDTAPNVHVFTLLRVLELRYIDRNYGTEIAEILHLMSLLDSKALITSTVHILGSKTISNNTRT